MNYLTSDCSDVSNIQVEMPEGQCADVSAMFGGSPTSFMVDSYADTCGTSFDGTSLDDLDDALQATAALAGTMLLFLILSPIIAIVAIVIICCFCCKAQTVVVQQQ